MDKTFAEPEQAEDVPVKNEKILDAKEEIMTKESEIQVEEPYTAAARPPSLPQDYDEWCNFVNDTKYTVMITDKDGTRPLKPGKSTTNVGIPGFKVILVLKLPNKDAQIEFPLSGFNNSTQNISQIYENDINQN